MSEIKTKIRTYNDVIDLFGEEKAADMLSEALDWSTIDPKNDKKNIMNCLHPGPIWMPFPPSARKSSINLPDISNLPALPAGSSCPESMSWIPMR